jgi:hypothetical protein
LDLLLAEFEKLTGAAELMEVEQPFTFRFDDRRGVTWTGRGPSGA